VNLSTVSNRQHEPCSGADLLAPADSEANSRCSASTGAGPPLPTISRAVLRSLDGSGVVLPTSVVLETDP
jgi:hypothetical protein